ncbi:MAG: sulfotransferase [Granulosicoccus sp.]
MNQTKTRKPNLLLIGAPRCASSALAAAINHHPSIHVCDPKEPHFLAMDGSSQAVSGLGAESFSKKNRMDRGQWSSLFCSKSERFLVDASVSTISYPDTAITNIRKYCDPDVKIIAILRNPVERAFSSYMYCVSRGWDAGTFEQSLEQESERIDNNWQHLWFFRYLSEYENRLKPFYAAFPDTNIHLMITEEFSTEPGKVLLDLFQFLDIDEIDINAYERCNSGGAPKTRIVRELSTLVNQRPVLRNRLKRLTSQHFRDSIRFRYFAKTDMALETRADLKDSLCGASDWVQNQLGRELRGWS